MYSAVSTEKSQLFHQIDGFPRYFNLSLDILNSLALAYGLKYIRQIKFL